VVRGDIFHVKVSSGHFLLYPYHVFEQRVETAFELGSQVVKIFVEDICQHLRPLLIRVWLPCVCILCVKLPDLLIGNHSILRIRPLALRVVFQHA
jgi:hypothetical protein